MHIQTRDSRLRIAATALVLVAFAPLADAARMTCWTNKDGVRECGDTVPPEYAQKETRTISDQGLTISVQPRAKTPEELAAERRREEEERQRLEEEARQHAEQTAYDRYLLATFTREEEINATRDRKLVAIEANINLTRTFIADYERRLEDLRRQAAASERGGKPLTPELQADMQRQRDLIAEKEAYIAGREREMDTLREEYRVALERFRVLKGSK